MIKKIKLYSSYVYTLLSNTTGCRFTKKSLQVVDYPKRSPWRLLIEDLEERCVGGGSQCRVSVNDLFKPSKVTLFFPDMHSFPCKS